MIGDRKKGEFIQVICVCISDIFREDIISSYPPVFTQQTFLESELTHQHLLPATTFSLDKTHATRVFVIVQGMTIGLIGLVHGIFASLRGNIPTGGYLLVLGIFTLIPNYLATGIAAILVGLSVVVWTLGSIQKKSGPTVFLALSILLFLVGGGVAQVPFFILTWGASIYISKPLTWWRKVLPEKLREQLAQLWITIWICDYIFLVAAIGIWLLLSPPSIAFQTPTVIQYTLWSFLCIGIVLQPLTILSGFAHDIQQPAPLLQSTDELEITK